MKKLGITLFVFFILLNTLTINAQICRVIDNPSFPSVPSSSFGDPSQLSLFEPTEVRTIYIAVHIVRSSSGTGGISTNDISTSIQQLNTSFTEVMIQFVHNQTDYIDNDTYYNLTQDEWASLRTVNTVSNKLNVYFVPEATGFTGIANYVSNTCAVTNAAAINGSTLAHEIGHNFYLYHTHGTGTQELVNQTNCSTAGDYLCDTPAEPYNNGDGILNYVYTNTCGYFGTFRDANNQLFTPDTHNFMGYSVPSCRIHFSSLQIQKINQTLMTNLTYLINTQVPLSNKIDDNLITNIPNVRTSTLTVVGVTTVNSGSFANLLDGNSYDIKTNQERFPAYSTFGNIKHNNWNLTTSQYKLTENYTVIRTASPYRDANFKTMKYSLIQGNVDNVITSGSFQFQDPWYVKSDGTQPGNYWIPCTATYEPNGKDGATEKGVFLDQPIISGKPYYSVKVDAVHDFYLTQTGKTHKFYFQSWSYDQNKVTLQNPTLNETPVVFTQEGATITANLKGTELSDNINAFSSNSQKKIVRDSNGWLHKIYESMGKVWYERSTNSGTTWTIQNNGKPLSMNACKSPSIDYGSSNVFITWQEKYGSSENSIIRLSFILNPYGQFVYYDVFYGGSSFPYSYNATPVIAWAYSDPNYYVVVAWKSSSGIMYRYGYLNPGSGLSWYTPEDGEIITGTDNNSANPTISVRKDGGATVFHLAWQQSTTAIKYRTLTPNGSNLTISAEETPSSGDNVSYKRNPSISVITTQPTLVWVGANYLGAIKKVYKRTRGTSSWGSFSIYGYEAESPTEYNGIIVWSESEQGINYYNKMFRWGSIKTLPTIGKFIQASNGPSANSMYAVVHRNVSPYEFQTTQSLGSLPKIIISNSGREGIISKGNADFGFVIADVTCNGDVVAFENVDDTTVIANISNLNNYLSTTAFTPNEGSNLVFSIAYGTNDSLEAINALNDGSNISFTLELVDANTNEILSTIDNFVFDENNICSYGEQSYNINMQGIGNRNVKLRATSNTSFNGSYNLANIYAESNILGKNNSRELSFNGGSVITTYDLYQNYPNPFNPSTTIKFQIPNDGFVTLKLYDILGNEVSILVNEQKLQGRYEVDFNANNLASGIYIYKIQAGDFVSSKKMLLLK